MTAPGRYATADAVADETAALALEGLPLDFTTRNLRAVADLDARATSTGLPPGRHGGVDASSSSATPRTVVPALDGRVGGPVSTVAL